MNHRRQVLQVFGLVQRRVRPGHHCRRQVGTVGRFIAPGRLTPRCFDSLLLDVLECSTLSIDRLSLLATTRHQRNAIAKAV
jgi:hypothetical protein